MICNLIFPEYQERMTTSVFCNSLIGIFYGYMYLFLKSIKLGGMNMSPGAIRGSRGLIDYAPCICLEMRLGERTRLTKFGELDSR